MAYCWYPGDLHIFEKQLLNLSQEHNLFFRRCSEYHFQIKGLFLVNVYPTRGSFYVQGTNHKAHFDKVEELAKIANGKSDKHFSTIEKGVRKYGKNRKKKLKMWEKEENRVCFFCGNPIENFEDASIEHKIPLSKGGSNRHDNLALSHRSCNHERGNKLTVKEEK